MARKKKQKTEKNSNIVVKTDVVVNDEVMEAANKLKSYCTEIIEDVGCEHCMFSTVLFMEGTGDNYCFCNVGGNRKPHRFNI